MPFFNHIENEAGILGIWKISESIDELIHSVQLSGPEKLTLKSIKNDKRKKEFLVVRILLNKLIENNPEIGYEESGRPYLKNSRKKISISHSSELAVVLLSDKNVGIDVENANRNITPIVKRFLTKKELENCSKSNNLQLTQTIYWCAKEAIFKCASETNIQFNHQIYIHPFEVKNEGILLGDLKTGNQNLKFKLGYFKLENNIIVYCVEL